MNERYGGTHSGDYDPTAEQEQDMTTQPQTPRQTNEKGSPMNQDTKPTILGREPIAFMVLIQASLGLVAAFGLDLSPEAVGAVMIFSAAILGFVARTQVSPIETLPDRG